MKRRGRTRSPGSRKFESTKAPTDNDEILARVSRFARRQIFRFCAAGVFGGILGAISAVQVLGWLEMGFPVGSAIGLPVVGLSFLLGAWTVWLSAPYFFPCQLSKGFPTTSNSVWARWIDHSLGDPDLLTSAVDEAERGTPERRSPMGCLVVSQGAERWRALERERRLPSSRPAASQPGLSFVVLLVTFSLPQVHPFGSELGEGLGASEEEREGAASGEDGTSEALKQSEIEIPLLDVVASLDEVEENQEGEQGEEEQEEDEEEEGEEGEEPSSEEEDPSNEEEDPSDPEAYESDPKFVRPLVRPGESTIKEALILEEIRAHLGRGGKRAPSDSGAPGTSAQEEELLTVFERMVERDVARLSLAPRDRALVRRYHDRIRRGVRSSEGLGKSRGKLDRADPGRE